MSEDLFLVKPGTRAEQRKPAGKKRERQKPFATVHPEGRKHGGAGPSLSLLPAAGLNHRHLPPG